MAFKAQRALLSAPVRLSLGFLAPFRILILSCQISSAVSFCRAPTAFYTQHRIASIGKGTGATGKFRLLLRAEKVLLPVARR
jgi:hypothetical protein